MTRPRIAVPAYTLGPSRIDGWFEPGIAVPQTYLDALAHAGAREAVLGPRALAAGDADELLDGLDGLLLLGGDDIDPATYGARAHPATGGVSARRDGFELALLAAARRRRMPTLAICRGMQLLSTAQGGTLHQHLPDDATRLAHGDPTTAGGGCRHEVALTPGSRVAQAVGATVTVVASQHHQAIDRVGTGLVVTGWAPDGVVEAVEVDGDGWVVGVQWHPEDTASHDPQQRALFEAFVRVAAAPR